MILRSSVPLIAHQWFCLCGISGCFLAALQPRREVVLWPVEPSAKLHRLGQSTGLEICIDCASAPIAKLRAQFGECQKTLHLLHHPFRFQVVHWSTYQPCANGAASVAISTPQGQEVRNPGFLRASHIFLTASNVVGESFNCASAAATASHALTGGLASFRVAFAPQPTK